VKEENKSGVVVEIEIGVVDHVKREKHTRKQYFMNMFVCG
jgi:hypothetical protein